MKTALSMAALVVLLASGCESSSVAEQANVTTSAKPTTRLYVRTDPEGAEIRLSDGQTGTSPQLFQVLPGVSRITVEMELGGHKAEKRIVGIYGGRIIRVEFDFTQGTQPQKRRFVCLVVGKDRITFEGKETTWKELPKLLENVPDRKHTVLQIARAPEDMGAKHWDQAQGRALRLVQRLGFEYLSDVGEHPLGFSGPTKHHSVCLVVGKDRMTFQGEDTTWAQLRWLLERIADRKHTVLNFARAPGELTVKQWHQARSRAVGLAERFGFDHLSDIGEHPLGSKWEETQTLSETPSYTSGGVPAKSIWDRVMHPPKGWTIEKSFIVPPDQTAAIGKKLGGPIKRLSNTIYSAHGQRVQVNVIECWTNPDAEDIHKSVLATKGDPAYALELGDTIVEFVGTFDVAFAKRLAKELLARKPEPASFGPVIERVVNDDKAGKDWLIDLDTGKLYTPPQQLDPEKNPMADPKKLAAWARQRGIDATGVKASEGILVGVELFVTFVGDASWESVTPQQVRDALECAAHQTGLVPPIGGKDFPVDALYAFRTREGGMGVLQVVGRGAHPPSVKIRYKLVQETVKPPAEPSTGISARSIWDRMMNPPEDWKVEKSFIVPEDKMGAIRKELGGRIKKISNTIYSAHGQQVQVNLIECATSAEAEKIHRAVLAMKGNPAYALRFDNTIVEFVGTFDVAFAKRAARELGLQPVPREPRGVSFGSVVEQSLSGPLKAVAELLDLDTGRRATMQEFGRNDRETHRWIRQQRVDLLGARERAGAGVLLFDVAVWANPSLDWDKITAAEVRDHQALAQAELRTITAIADEDLSKLPLTCLFRTREGALGVLQLVGVEGPRAVKIRYKLVQLPDEQTVRQVIYKFAKACVESDKDTVANLLHEKSRHLLEQIDDMQEIMSAGIKPAEIDQVLVRGHRALAATKLTQVRHRHYPQPVCLVYTLEKQGGSWVLRDVDVEDKPGLEDEIHRFNVRTSRRGAAREGELPAAASRAKQLKTNIDSFTLTLARYSGEKPPGPPQQSLVLHVPTNGFKHTRAVQIDKRQAEQIIDHLAAEGFLNSFHDMHEWKFIEAPRGTHYMLSVQAGDAHFAQHLSWNRSMLSRLQELRKVLRGEAAEAMDQLLGPPAEKGSPE